MKTQTKIKILSILIFFQISHWSYANKDSILVENLFVKATNSYYTNLGNTLNTLDLIQQITAINNDWRNHIEASLMKATCAMYHHDIELSFSNLKLTDNLISIHKNDLGSEYWDFLALCEVRWGYYYILIIQYEKAIQVFSNLIDAILLNPKRYNYGIERLSSSYSNLAWCLKAQGKYLESLDHYYLSLKYKKELSKRSPGAARISLAFRNIGEISMILGNYQKSKSNYLKALKIQEKNYLQNPNSEKNRLIGTLNQLSLLYSKTNNIDSALICIEKSFEIHDDGDPKLKDTYRILGEIQMLSGNFQLSYEAYSHALEIEKSFFGDHHVELVNTLNSLGKLYVNFGQLNEGIQYYQNSLKCIFPSFSYDSIMDHNLGTGANNKFKILETLLLKCDAFQKLYYKKKDPKFLKEVWNNSTQGLAIMDSIRFDYSIQKDKHLLTEKFYQLNSFAIHSGKKIFDLEKEDKYQYYSFYASEKSKSLLLFESIKENTIEYNLESPSDSLERLWALRKMISQLKESIKNENDIGRLNYINKQLLSFKMEFQNLQLFLEKKNPAYFKYKYKLQPPSVLEICSKLSPNQALIEYFISDSIVFIFIIDKNGLKIEHREWNDGFSKMAQTINQNLSNDQDEAYVNQAYLLFEQLIKPAIDSTDAKQLIIVPDGELWKIPFVALLQKKVKNKKSLNYKKLPYLINDYTISYAFSAALWKEMKERPSPRKNLKILAFGPSYREVPIFDDDPIAENQHRFELTPLRYNQLEAIEVTKSTNGQIIIEGNASKKTFLDSLLFFEGLHLACHAKADLEHPDSSYIGFSNIANSIDDSVKLYVHEIYQLRLPLEIVVLSACKTGTGPIWKGEGQISLERAFAYGGTNSILSTLWNINDGSTSELMPAFYKYLNNGVSKDEALRMAQLKYIKVQKKKKNTHPKHWAAFRAIGNMEPISFPRKKSKYFWLIVIGIGVCSFLGGLFYLNRKRLITN